MNTTLTEERRKRLHRRVRFIVAFTITYNVIEAVIAITAGAQASSAALIGFGLDSSRSPRPLTLTGGRRPPSEPSRSHSSPWPPTSPSTPS
jgi:hypothetical protein